MNYTPEEISILERIAIAKNPETPKNVLKELANDPEKKVRIFVAANVNTPKTVLTKLAGEGGQISRYVATNPNTPAQVLRQLAIVNKYPAPNYSEYVVSNSNAPESLLKKLAESSSVIDRYYLAANPQAPVSVLRKLAANRDKESPLVLENVAWNPNAPEDLLADIRESREKWAIVTEIDPYLDVEQIGNDYQIACHINTSLSTLEKLAKHENWLVRYLVRENPNTPKSLADAIVAEIAQTTSLPDDSRKCLVLNMLKKMPSHIPFSSLNGLPIIAIADEIVDFRWHYFEGDSLSFHDATESKVIGVVQKGEFQKNVNEDKFEEVCRIISIECDDFQLDDISDKHKELIKEELAANFQDVQSWIYQQGFSFIPSPSDFLKICSKKNYGTSGAGYWRLGRSYYNNEEYWLDEYLNELIGCWFLQEYSDIFYGNEFNEIVDKLHELAATHQEHSRYVLEFWDGTVIENPDRSSFAENRNPVFNTETFDCNPEYDIQSMLETLQQDSGLTTQDELKATISRLLEIAPLTYYEDEIVDEDDEDDEDEIVNEDEDEDEDEEDEDEIVPVLALHQDLVIEVSGLEIVRDADEIDKNNENKVYFYMDDTCIDYDSFVAKQDWDSLFKKSESNTLLAYIAYLLIKIILFNKSGEN